MVLAFHYLYRGQKPGWISSHPAIAVAAVAKYGFLGVNLFFLISGFVIFMSAERASLREFVASRTSRLFPAFWASVLLTALCAWIFGSQNFQASIIQVAANLSMIPNWFGIDYVDGAYWSLSVELNFYIAIGIVLFFRKIDKIEWILAIWLIACLIYVVRPVYLLDVFLNARYGSYFCGGISAYLIRSRGLNGSRGALFLISLILAIAQYVVPGLRGHSVIAEDTSIWISAVVVAI